MKCELCGKPALYLCDPDQPRGFCKTHRHSAEVYTAALSHLRDTQQQGSFERELKAPRACRVRRVRRGATQYYNGG